MAGNTQPYLFDPRGDGVRAPIRQTAIRNPTGLLAPAVAAKLWMRRRAARKPFASAINGLSVYSHVEPSAFSQFGRGRLGQASMPPPFFGGKSDRLKLKIGGRRRLAPRIKSSLDYAPTYGGLRYTKYGGISLATISRINPGSF